LKGLNREVCSKHRKSCKQATKRRWWILWWGRRL